ncbi:hypothetical protein [Carboxylicivirga linearis]|uniref:Uncharacterized protein n=1 Tax=Carboxylicivirga linearis TaxID=1628157 RepID=A0ABS5K1J6_9BACT|nr:hypothetical protein [Carboxylicivirga linearis]MBS2101016.1 hypothetical protein [Carboxylicivirga linearis]
MKKLLTLMVLLLAGITFTIGQNTADSIRIEKTFGGYQFYQGEKRLKVKDLVNTMQSNAQAYQEIKSAQSSYTLASIVGFAGGFMVGWPLGSALGGGEPNWTMAGIGAGLIVVSIPISKSFNKKAKQAVDTYNNGLQTSSFWDNKELRLSVNENGLGLTLRF